MIIKSLTVTYQIVKVKDLTPIHTPFMHKKDYEKNNYDFAIVNAIWLWNYSRAPKQKPEYFS